MEMGICAASTRNSAEILSSGVDTTLVDSTTPANKEQVEFVEAVERSGGICCCLRRSYGILAAAECSGYGEPIPLFFQPTH